jgi:hypothetical protein
LREEGSLLDQDDQFSGQPENEHRLCHYGLRSAAFDSDTKTTVCHVPTGITAILSADKVILTVLKAILTVVKIAVFAVKVTKIVIWYLL